MLTFKQFDNINKLFEEMLLIEQEWKNEGGKNLHSTSINGHDITVYSIKNPIHRGTEHYIGFTVNNIHSKGNVDSTTGKHISAHVSSAINSYIKNNVKRTDRIRMAAADSNDKTIDKKSSIYSHFAKRIAKKHGMEYSSHETRYGTSHVMAHPGADTTDLKYM